MEKNGKIPSQRKYYTEAVKEGFGDPYRNTDRTADSIIIGQKEFLIVK